MPEANSLQIIAENYGLPGMVLASVVLFLAFLAWVIKSGPAWITAIRGEGQSRKKTPDYPAPTRTARPGVMTTAYTREEVAKGRAETDEKVDLKLQPLKDALERGDERLDKLETHTKEQFEEDKNIRASISKIKQRLVAIEAGLKAGAGRDPTVSPTDDDADSIA